MTRTFFLRLWRVSLALTLLGSAVFSFLAWQDAREARDLAAALSSALDAHDFGSNVVAYEHVEEKLDHLRDAVGTVSHVLVKHAGY